MPETIETNRIDILSNLIESSKRLQTGLNEFIMNTDTFNEIILGNNKNYLEFNETVITCNGLRTDCENALFPLSTKLAKVLLHIKYLLETKDGQTGKEYPVTYKLNQDGSINLSQRTTVYNESIIMYMKAIGTTVSYLYYLIGLGIINKEDSDKIINLLRKEYKITKDLFDSIDKTLIK